MRRPARGKAQTKRFEADEREQQHDLPIDSKGAQHLPRAAVQAHEDERREVPDRLFRAQLAEAATGEAASDGKRQRDEFAPNERRQPDEGADGDAGIRAIDQARQKRPFEREVGGVVPEQQARGHARRKRDAEAEGEHQAIRPRPMLENEDVPEAPEPRQHRRRGRHDRELDDERRQEHLLGREKLLALHGFT